MSREMSSAQISGHEGTAAGFAEMRKVLARPGGFVKMHGAGNDFILFDGRQIPFRPDAAQCSRLCDRHFGVGGDQVLVLEDSRQGCDLRLRIYNIDGREAETCLNATRCVAWFSMLEREGSSAKIETAGGVIEARLAGEGRVTLRQPAPRFDWHAVPLAEPRDTMDLRLSAGPLMAQAALSMGNPHLVCFVDDLDAVDVPLWADQLQKHSLLPEGANIGVAQILGPAAMRLVVWERPGILTQACGSGACAAYVVARRLGLIEAHRLQVQMPGGVLEVEGEGEGLMLTGPVALVYQGVLAWVG